MAKMKKIRLDFTKVTERSSWNTKKIVEGMHLMEVVSVDDKDAGDGTPMLTYGLRPVDKKYQGRLFPFYCKLQENQLFKIRDLLVAAGIDVPKKALNIDPESPIGKVIAAEVTDATGQYEGRSEINGVYDKSVVGDDDSPVDDEDEDYEDEEGEEPDEDEEVEDDEEGDDEEEEDDELREELEGLTLAALRKRAKGLGIDTVGVKQPELIELVLEEELAEDDESDDEDEDEEDDEELDEEEFDDEEDEEEEEPEPAPRRKASKPAAKTAAKPTAKAAPAKRVVKRR